MLESQECLDVPLPHCSTSSATVSPASVALTVLGFARCLGHGVPQERCVQHTGIYDIFLLLCLGNELHKINSRFIIKQQDLETEAFP